MYTLYYVSQDAPNSTDWSVYRERYDHPWDEEPIDGTQERVSTHPTEAEAHTEARRLGFMTHGPVRRTWFGRGVWPTCLCGYDPHDNALLNAHWRAQGFEVVDDHGALITRPVTP